MYSVIIVDDHSIVLNGLSLLVNSFQKFKVIGLFNNGNSLIKELKLKANLPDIILMDIRMPIIDGIECTKLIKAEFPYIKVIALTFDEQYKTIIEMLEAGADGYLIKNINKLKFEKYLLDVILEKHKFTETISKTIIDSIKNNSVKTRTKLTEREIQFINFACSELSYSEIALKMNLSSRTIDGYRDSIYQKLNIKNRVGLVLYAIKNMIIHV